MHTGVRHLVCSPKMAQTRNRHCISFKDTFCYYSCVFRAFSLSLYQPSKIDAQVKRINNVTILESFLSKETKAPPNHLISKYMM